MRDKLIKLLESVPAAPDGSIGVARVADHLLDNGVIVPPCKVGDVVVWDNGLGKSAYTVKGFSYHPIIGVRLDLGPFEPFADHKNIVRIIPKEAEQALREVQHE